MIPPSVLLDGLLAIWPYLAGAAAIGSLIGVAIPVKKKHKRGNTDDHKGGSTEQC